MSAPTGTGNLANPTTGSPTKTAPLWGGRAHTHGSMPAAMRSSPASASSSYRSHRRHQCHRPRPPRRLSRRPSRLLRQIHRRRRSSARPAFCNPTPQESLGWRAPASPKVAARGAVHTSTASTSPTPRADPCPSGAQRSARHGPFAATVPSRCHPRHLRATCSLSSQGATSTAPSTARSTIMPRCPASALLRRTPSLPASSGARPRGSAPSSRPQTRAPPWAGPSGPWRGATQPSSAGPRVNPTTHRSVAAARIALWSGCKGQLAKPVVGLTRCADGRSRVACASFLDR